MVVAVVMLLMVMVMLLVVMMLFVMLLMVAMVMLLVLFLVVVLMLLFVFLLVLLPILSAVTAARRVDGDLPVHGQNLLLPKHDLVGHGGLLSCLNPSYRRYGLFLCHPPYRFRYLYRSRRRYHCRHRRHCLPLRRHHSCKPWS